MACFKSDTESNNDFLPTPRLESWLLTGPRPETQAADVLMQFQLVLLQDK